MIAYRVLHGKVLYVCDIKHKLQSGKYCDWSYTSKVQDAVKLSKHWIDRFVSDMKFVGAEYKIIERSARCL